MFLPFVILQNKGMLISGELYIQMKEEEKDEKIKSMFNSISSHLDKDVVDSGVEPAAEKPKSLCKS